MSKESKEIKKHFVCGVLATILGTMFVFYVALGISIYEYLK
ncbi:MAG: hypothetical protein GOVbin8609_61 [Prokaryotic dsDNA virus sp.]|nr:MAG: hypothetical protein GOVbin8609_61 [Prokaryotic dsDNA virus sp.]|tara:strand:- start:12546 stop:12668 length:123 start_codon:yes stop_codon:yes gene_type:complete